MVSQRHFVIAVVGPTGTGKSALAEALALHLQGEIISADSMQVYKGMDIGTAKVPLNQRAARYHCLDIVAPGEEFNASQYQTVAREAIEDIWARGKQPILCGGTGLYVRAALDDFKLDGEAAAVQSGEAGQQDTYAAELQNASTQLRQRLEAEAEQLGPEAFHAKLASLDPKSASLIHPNNVRRVVRAFEWLNEGSSYAQQAAGFDTNREVYPTVFLGLDMPREELYPRINRRVDTMLEEGLLDEVNRLVSEGYEQALTAQQAIGYKELLQNNSRNTRGQSSCVILQEAVEHIKQSTRKYAKRQKSWFRRDTRIQWLDAREPLDVQLDKALAIIAAQ